MGSRSLRTQIRMPKLKGGFIMTTIKIGFAPTRRSIFSAPDAVKYRGLTKQKLEELGISFVDIDDINEEGLLYDEKDRLKIVEKFKAEKIDGLFLPHCNFGTEYECARLAKDLNVPVLLWGSMNGRMKRAFACAIPSVASLLPVKYFVGLESLLRT